MAKDIDVDGIKPLPKSLHKKFYGEDYDPKTWKLRYSGLSDDEKQTLRAFLKVQDAKKAYWIPEVNYPEGINTPDLLVDEVRVEVKSATTENSIERRTESAVEQLNGTGVLLINAGRTKLTEAAFTAQLEDKAKENGIKAFAVAKNGEIIAYKKIVPKPQAEAHDAGLSYTSILPKNGKKANPLPEIIGVAGIETKTGDKIPGEGYWENRAIEQLTTTERQTQKYLDQTLNIYNEAQRQTVKQVQDLYRSYYTSEGWDTTALDEIVPNGDLLDFQSQLKEAGLKSRLPKRFNGRLSRLEMLNAQLWLESKKAAKKADETETAAHTETIKDTYYRTIFNTAKGLGTIPAFATLDKRTLNDILNTKFVGANYSSRIWKNTTKLANNLQSIIGQAVALGQPAEVTARQIRKQFNVSRNDAMRLVLTETNYFQNRSSIEAYKEMGIKRYQYLAVLDGRTSQICRDHDKKIYCVSQARSGYNLPPLHPYCRSTVTPYLGREYEPRERIARDPNSGKNYYVPGNINYGNWRKSVDRLATTKPKLHVSTQTLSTVKKLTDAQIISEIGVTAAYWRDTMEASERSFARSYGQEHNITWIDKNSRIDPVTNRPLETNDYKYGKHEYELKTPNGKRLKYSSIAKMISGAASKGYKKNFMINLGQRSLSKSIKSGLEMYNQRHDVKIERLRVWSRGKEIKIKLK